MRIAVTADPEIPVPPVLYGGVERQVDMLVRGLVDAGHEVTLFAHPDSNVPCRLIAYRGGQQGSMDILRNMWQVSSEVARGGYDILHSFGRVAYLLPILPLSIRKVMSYQRAITPRTVAWGERLAHGTLYFAACSRWLAQPWLGRPNWHVVYNAAPRCAYQYRATVEPDAPLVFLGRIEPIKGPHLAIQVARASEERLVLAGNVPEYAQTYFENEIAPHIDGEQIQYVGPVDDAQKDGLLGSSRALLMPIIWDEPFGIVMAEALACGTPVIGFARGAVPEVVTHGLTGFVCGSQQDMVEAISALPAIDRRACRQDMEARFSEDVMVESYLRVYEAM